MARTSEYKKPLPTPSHVSRPFWDAEAAAELTEAVGPELGVGVLRLDGRN